MNRHFGVTVLAVCLCAELFLRTVPSLPAPLFRALYGNSLAMLMTIRDRLDHAAPDLLVLALGDSLAMTQFQPDLFAEGVGLQPGEVFNAAYLGMSFPSQEDMLRSVGPEKFGRLEHVLFFVNPRRFSPNELPNTDVFRVGIPPADGVAQVAWRTKRVAPILDRVRLYGLSRHLVSSAWRPLFSDPPSWDHVELLGPSGGVAWPHARPNGNIPTYPYPPLDDVSADRLEEMRRVVLLLRATGAQVTMVASAVHPSAAVFASAEARQRYDAALKRIASETGSRYRAEAIADFQPNDDRDFCDYGHMNAAGGEAYTRHLLRQQVALSNGN